MYFFLDPRLTLYSNFYSLFSFIEVEYCIKGDCSTDVRDTLVRLLFFPLGLVNPSEMYTVNP